MAIEFLAIRVEGERSEEVDLPPTKHEPNAKARSPMGQLVISAVLVSALTQPAISEETGHPNSSLPISSDSGSGLMKPTNLVRFAPSGVKQRIANITLADVDCAPGGIAVPRIIEKPSYGKLEFQNSEIAGTWSVGNPREKCSEKRYPSLVVYYTSDDKYLGADSAKLLMIYPDGSANEWDFIIAGK